MADYSELAARLAVVRRAWKRRRMVAGLAIVLLESLAIFTLFLLADWLYRPVPAVRTGLFVAALAAIAVLVVRHIVVHLLRRIPDEQVALYVEEHRAQFQGALMTAAEFGRARDVSPGQARMIDAAMRAAVNRASGLDLRAVVSLRRFRKYGWTAAGLLVVYAGMCVLLPESVGHHAFRVLTPWRSTPEDLAREVGPAGRPFEAARKTPISLALSRGDTRVPRGGQFDLEAALSRPPDEPVVLRFRPVAEGTEGAWREIPLKAIEKLNGFAAALQDVNEDLQFYVATGEYQSEAHDITVYDPLAIVAVEVRTSYPAYLDLPERVEPTATGDVAAPVGSTVTVRLMANNELAGGELKWEGGPETALEVGEAKTVATASFDVTKDGVYGFRLRDVDGQELASPVPSYVRALRDQPPTLDVKFPRIDVVTHPLGQLSVLVDASDDWAVASAELVYQLAAEGAPEVRLPLKLAPAKGAGAASRKALEGTTTFSLEEAKPAVEPGRLITYHLECRDQKGQVAMSDIYMITVTPFEQWATWGMEYPEFGAHGGYLSEALSVILAAVWHLHTQKPLLPQEDFNTQAEQLAAKMVDPGTGEVFPFIKLKKVPPEKMEHGKRVPVLAKQAHGALVAHDTGKALEYLRLGVAELAMVGLSESPLLLARGGGALGAGAEPQPESVLSQVATFMMEAEDMAAGMQLGTSNFEIIGPEYRRELRKIEEAEQLAKKAEDLRRGEQDILERAVAMTDQAAGQPAGAEQGGQPSGDQQAGQPAGAEQNAGNVDDPHGGAEAGDPQGGQQGAEPPSGQPAGAESGRQGGGDSAASLAQDQRGLAEMTKAAAMDARAAADTDAAFGAMADKMDDAARNMFVAAAKFKKGEVGPAVADVRRAQDNLLEAVKSVQGLQRHSLEQALDVAQAHAERVLRDQREVRSETQAVGDRIGQGGTADPGAQRDLGRLAYRQGELRGEAARLGQELGNLQGLVQRGARPDTTRSVDEANRGIARHRIAQKMTNAAVELDAGRPGTAAGEQVKAEVGIAAVLGKLREAAGTLASDYKSELARAKYEADRVASALERLGGGEADGEAGTGQPPAGQGDRQGGDETTQPTGEGQAGESAAGPLGPGQRRELSRQAAADLAQLGRHLERRQFAPDEAGQIWQVTEDPDRLAGVLASEQAKRDELLGVVRRVGNKLMAELQAKLDAERLKNFQREECPPQYRPLVNKYYELLGAGAGP